MRGTLRSLAGAVAWLLLAPSALAGPTSELFDDGRDAYTLFPRHLVNHQLFSQLSAPDQATRLGRDWGRFAFAADLSIGTQQTFDGSPQSRFHGFYLADTYTSVRLVDGLDANLNLLLVNPSASDGYRVSSQISAGLALHASRDLVQIAGYPLHLDVLGTDLGWVTLGAGLLLEQIPLEGVTGALSYRDLQLIYTFAGRALWDDDDVIRTGFSAFGGRVGVMHIEWHKKDLPLGTAEMPGLAQQTSVHYADAFLDLPLPGGFHCAAEYAARLDQRPKSGVLSRVDYLGRPWSWFEAHVGYQFRWYEQGVGPRDELLRPTVPFNLPYQEDVYATNSFEYLYASHYMTEWSHTLMLEERAHLGQSFELLADTELWLRNAASFGEPRLSFSTPDGFLMPGHKLTTFYRVGARVFPWPGLPHRASFFVTNKQALGGAKVSDAVDTRFDPGTYWVLELEAFL